jgi:hypothetical protein
MDISCPVQPQIKWGFYMRFMMIVRATRESETGGLPDEKMISEMMKYNEELAKAGVLVSLDGLHPSSKGVRIRYSGKDRKVIKGPFPDKELIAGFWIIKVKSMDEAIEWAKRAPNPMQVESDIELRQIFEAEDFGSEMTPELKKKEEHIREMVNKK